MRKVATYFHEGPQGCGVCTYSKTLAVGDLRNSRLPKFHTHFCKKADYVCVYIWWTLCCLDFSMAYGRVATVATGLVPNSQLCLMTNILSLSLFLLFLEAPWTTFQRIPASSLWWCFHPLTIVLQLREAAGSGYFALCQAGKTSCTLLDVGTINLPSVIGLEVTLHFVLGPKTRCHLYYWSQYSVIVNRC